MNVRLSWLLLLLLGGCPKRGPERDRELERLLSVADAAWARRDEIGLEEASAPLMDAWARDPRNAGVSWRLARQRIAEGIVTEDAGAARASFADARSTAVTCLDKDVVSSRQRELEGSKLTLDGISVARTRCAAWGALAWSRWMATMGGAATTLDLDAVDALVKALATTSDPEAKNIAAWAEAIVAALRPTWMGGDLVAARAAFDRAVALDPEAVVRRVDRYTLVLLPAHDVDAPDVRQELVAAVPHTPEDRAAQRRLLEADPERAPK